MNETLNVAIALVPTSAEILDIICEISQSDASQEHEKLALNAKEALPHITLAMLNLPKTNLESLLNSINEKRFECARKEKVEVYENNQGQKITWLAFELSEELETLHHEAMKLRTLFHCQPESFTGISEGCALWVNHFEKKAQPYQPHITLGIGDFAIDKLPQQIEFQLGLFELHSNCQLRKLS